MMRTSKIQRPIKMSAKSTFIAAFFIAINVLFICGERVIFTSAIAAEPTAAKPALTVATARAQTAPLGLQLSANGNIAAWQDAVIGAQSNGLVLKDVLVNVGDSVRKGQVLARFGSETLLADVAQAQASLAEGQATAADAQANAERARSVQGTDVLSTQQIAQYLTAEKTAQARVNALQASVNAQQLRLAQAEVLAPDSGIISARAATVGAVVGAGTELFRFVRQGRLEWRAEVTSAELPRLKPGTLVTVTTATGAQLAGKVRMVGPTVDPLTRAALVYVDIPPMNPARTGVPVLPGMFAKGVFALGDSTGLTIAQQAVVIRDGFTSVFRLDAGNRVKQLRVTTGRRSGAVIELLDGVKPEDQLVVSGAGFLNDGDLVKVVPALISAVKP
jgi:RND family efflux transporter MFP subunit